LTDEELAVWEGFVRLHAELLTELDRDLRVAHGLPLVHYKVLIHLDRAPDQGLRMMDLAYMVHMTQSGATRLVDRMEKDGYVVRDHCVNDARVAYARLTQSGKELLVKARPTHLAAIRKRFLGCFDQAELAQLAATWERVRPGVTAT
jgi:DNA-binding MarR family transcriptional regulator